MARDEPALASGAVRSTRGWHWGALYVTALVVGVALRHDALRVPFAFDDYAHLAMLDGVYPVHRSPLDLYDFANGNPAERQLLMDRGSLPWWSHSRIEFAMLRPLSSALIALDHVAWRGNAFAAHAHSAAWWALALLALVLLVRDLVAFRTAVLAVALFTGNAAATLPLAWIANRNALVSLALGLLALWAYQRWRTRGTVRWAAVACAAMSGSLLGGEYALSICAYVIAFELFVTRDAALAKLRAAWPVWVPLTVFVITQRALHYGAAGSALYVDPVTQPRAFAHAAWPRFLALVADLVLGVPADRWGDPPTPMATLAMLATLASVIALGSFALASRAMDSRARTVATWSGVGSICALVPPLASLVGPRLALMAVPGVCIASAVILSECARTLSDRDSPPARRVACAVAALVLVAIGFVWAPRRAWLDARNTRAANIAGQAGLRASEVDPRGLGDARLVLLTAADPQTLLYAPTSWYAHGAPMPRAWWVLSMAPGFHALLRTASDTLLLQPLQSQLLTTPAEVLFRAPDEPFRAGDTVHLAGLTITVVAVGPRGPSQVSFRFDRALDDPALRFYQSTADGLRRFRIPRIGEPVLLPPAQIPARASAVSD